MKINGKNTKASKFKNNSRNSSKLKNYTSTVGYYSYTNRFYALNKTYGIIIKNIKN